MGEAQLTDMHTGILAGMSTVYCASTHSFTSLRPVSPFRKWKTFDTHTHTPTASSSRHPCRPAGRPCLRGGTAAQCTQPTGAGFHDKRLFCNTACPPSGLSYVPGRGGVGGYVVRDLCNPREQDPTAVVQATDCGRHGFRTTAWHQIRWLGTYLGSYGSRSPSLVCLLTDEMAASVMSTPLSPATPLIGHIKFTPRPPASQLTIQLGTVHPTVPSAPKRTTYP